MDSKREIFLARAHDDVVQFRRAFNQPCPRHWLDGRPEDRVLQAALIREEFTETMSAEDQLAQLDGYCDLLYVLLGGMIVLSMTMDDVRAAADSASTFAGDVAVSVEKLEAPGLPCRILWTHLPRAAVRLYNCAAGLFPRFTEAFDRVHEANMGKLWDEDLTLTSGEYSVHPAGLPGYFIVKRADGKIVKPPTFTPPNLRPFV